MQRADDFRFYLLRELEQRQKKNPSYSLRAFARDLEMSPQKLNQVLKGKSGISPESAEQVATKIKLSKLEQELFLSLVAAKHHRSKVLREEAKNRIEEVRSKMGFQQVSGEIFESISKWYHWACYHLVDIKTFRPDMNWVSKKLEISVDEATSAFNSLFGAGLLSTDANGNWTRTNKKFAFSSNTPSNTLRKFYREMLKKAEKTLDGEPMEARYFAVSNFAINESDREFIKAEMDTFRKNLIEKLLARDSVPTRVYSLSMQFFPLDKNEAGKS